MKEIYMTNTLSPIPRQEAESCMDRLLEQYPDVKKVLLIPPDFTRCYSYAGKLPEEFHCRTFSAFLLHP